LASSQQIVNTVSEVSSERISEATPSAYDITVMVWEDATVSSTPIGPDPVRNAIVALGLGLMVGIGLARLMEQRAT
jgi:capsular polysaccharide biosynthesis protein